jgi:hypothetical protein
MNASVGSPASISRAGAGACVTPSVQTRQAYFGRMVSMIRCWAGMTSMRMLRSSPSASAT